VLCRKPIGLRARLADAQDQVASGVARRPTRWKTRLELSVWIAMAGLQFDLCDRGDVRSR
jgi:hypothetical protein